MGVGCHPEPARLPEDSAQWDVGIDKDWELGAHYALLRDNCAQHATWLPAAPREMPAAARFLAALGRRGPAAAGQVQRRISLSHRGRFAVCNQVPAGAAPL